jgi:hypothetical protein
MYMFEFICINIQFKCNYLYIFIYVSSTQPILIRAASANLCDTRGYRLKGVKDQNYRLVGKDKVYRISIVC